MVYTEEKKKILGKNIWIRRECMSISRTELANRTNVTREVIGKWELGKHVPTKERLNELTKIFKCSKHDLHRPYNIPKLSLVETKEIIQKEEEPIMCDADIIKAATNVFKNSFTEPSVETVKTVEKPTYGHPVVDRVNKYLSDNDMSQYELAKKLSMSPASLNRVVHGVLLCNHPNYIKVEKYLDDIEEVNENVNTKNMCQLEIKFDEPIKEEPIKEEKLEEVKRTEENKSKEKGSLSDRFNIIYNTLFKALEDLDELKADIDKIEKVTSMLKEIQGL